MTETAHAFAGLVEGIGATITYLVPLFLLFSIFTYLLIIIIVRAILGIFHKVSPRAKNYISAIIPPLLISGYIVLTPNPFFALALFLPMIFLSGITLFIMNKLLKG